jgi:soluble cytochrome b562
MATNIEQIKTQLSETRNQIDSSKNLSNIEKLNKDRELEVLMLNIKSDLDELRENAEEGDLEEIELAAKELEELENTFKESKSEFSSLEGNVNSNIETKVEETEKKTKEKSWIKTKWDKIPE